MFSSIGAPEIIIIAVLLILLLGWKRLPDAARSLGRSMRIFKSEVTEMKHDGKSAASSDTVKGERLREQTENESPVRDKTTPLRETDGSAPDSAVHEANGPRSETPRGPIS